MYRALSLRYYSLIGSVLYRANYQLRRKEVACNNALSRQLDPKSLFMHLLKKKSKGERERIKSWIGLDFIFDLIKQSWCKANDGRGKKGFEI